jgi:hypothetical protein
MFPIEKESDFILLADKELRKNSSPFSRQRKKRTFVSLAGDKNSENN